VLDYADISGKRIIKTALHRTLTIPEANSAAAIEAMSRFAINPKWLIYLPPTMSPSATSQEPNLLEHPAEAFGYFAEQGVTRVICEEKHMGSRAIIVLCRTGDAAKARFGVETGETGAIYSRTGRTFFRDTAQTEEVLGVIRAAMDEARLWDELETDWICLDAEIMPWSAKAQGLIREQYAPAGSAARIGLGAAVTAMRTAAERGADMADLLDHFEARADKAARYADAYRGYCWDVASIDDLKIAPFHILATGSGLHMDQNHEWHMTTLARLATGRHQVIMATPNRVVDIADGAQVADVTDWWTGLTTGGGEGMVIKPLDFIVQGARGLVQPALKCRGPEYLRIIYGPEYDNSDNLSRLRRRGLGKKRSLASREFALGHEALTRFVAGEPLRRVHECVFAILALESEPVDPRL
jgi:protein phosphatase